jgi:CLIP-associating protein 1/2
LNLQEPRHIASQGARTIPVLLERLGDQKERHRALAAQCLSDVWKACPQDVEKSIRDVALASKNTRMKENAIHWIAKVCSQQLYLFQG